MTNNPPLQPHEAAIAIQQLSITTDVISRPYLGYSLSEKHSLADICARLAYIYLVCNNDDTEGELVEQLTKYREDFVDAHS